jgi:outer membrane immunogenic protein
VQETGTPTTAGTFGGATNETRVGWTAGAGTEWKVTNNVSVKAEYLHVDLGTSTVRTLDPVNFPANFFDYKFKNVEDIARAGVNYKF